MRIGADRSRKQEVDLRLLLTLAGLFWSASAVVVMSFSLKFSSIVGLIRPGSVSIPTLESILNLLYSSLKLCKSPRVMSCWFGFIEYWSALSSWLRNSSSIDLLWGLLCCSSFCWYCCCCWCWYCCIACNISVSFSWCIGDDSFRWLLGMCVIVVGIASWIWIVLFVVADAYVMATQCRFITVANINAEYMIQILKAGEL